MLSVWVKFAYTSFYSVVQYVPDPVADERLNVGVIGC
jgi:hypothetical protein